MSSTSTKPLSLSASPLRFGWTTGTCATAASVAAYQGMVTGEFPQEVAVTTPSGRVARLAISMTKHDHTSFTAGVIKDAGDDPDVTHGAEIRATLSPLASSTGIVFCRGEGVGEITRPGLPLPVGAPAINPVPQAMMREAITHLASTLGGTPHVKITISVPNGEELAGKTWNPRLGITGGISILGTTGVVRPFSCAAWIASIHQGIDVARANGMQHVVGCTGATSEAAALARFNLPPMAAIDMGDFVGGTLKYLNRHPIPQVTIAGGVGKLTKLAQGATDLHSARSQIDLPRLRAMAQGAGIAPKAIAPKTIESMQSAQEVMAAATPAQRKALALAIATSARTTAYNLLTPKNRTEIQLQVLVVGRDKTILAETGFGHG